MSTQLTSPYSYAPADEIAAEATTAVLSRHFVKISGTRTANGNLAVAPATAGSMALGVAAWDAAIGQLVRVARGGVVKVVAGAAISAGAAVQSDPNGAAVTATSGIVLGYAVSDAANAGVAEIAFIA